MAVDVDISTVHRGSGLVEVASLCRLDWCVVRTMRLAALHDSPDSFVNTWAAEWRLPSEYWRSCFTNSTWVVARAGTRYVGIARLAPPEHDLPGVPYIESVWVSPDHRRQGVVRRMLDRLECHARVSCATELRLWVLDTNESAMRAYQKLGFSPLLIAQDTMKRRSDATFVKERLISKPLL
jgi:ribosomal protein S18 acetylase RimI-like enzyme